MSKSACLKPSKSDAEMCIQEMEDDERSPTYVFTSDIPERIPFDWKHFIRSNRLIISILIILLIFLASLLAVTAFTLNSRPPVKKYDLREINVMQCQGKKNDHLKYSYIVQLKLDNGSSICKGEIITDEIIVTASHCPRIKNIGYIELNDGTIIRDFTEIDHENYDYGMGANDIRMIIPNDKLNLSKVQPICLLYDFKPYSSKLTLVKMYNNNFGAGSKYFETDLPVLRRNICSYKWKNASAHTSNPKNAYKPITRQHICTIDSEFNPSSVKGDSGSPLIEYDEDGIQTLRGIVSYGNPKHALPTVYTNITAYTNWMETVIQNFKRSMKLFL